MTLDLIAARLYGLTPDEFTAARDVAVKQAKADGDPDLAQQVKALRKPSVGAWLVNLLATQEPDLLDDAEAFADLAEDQRTKAERAGEEAVDAVRDAQLDEAQARVALDRLRRR